jgi:threonine/homoserine/homoserine lactone efflux protein
VGSIYTTFLVTTALFGFIPGPAMLYAAGETMAKGRWSGMMAAFGIHLGAYVHVACSAAGLSVLFQSMPTLCAGIKFAGAGYLIWLGATLIRSRESADDRCDKESSSNGRTFWESLGVEVLNPKTAIFFLAFLPQFIDRHAPVPIWVQFLALGTVVNIIFSVADVTCVLLAGVLAGKLGRSGRGRLVARCFGGVLIIGLAIHLAVEPMG